MINKSEITLKLLELWPGPGAPCFNDAMVNWYYNIRINGGLRLTPEGFRVLTQVLDCENWSYTIPDVRKINKQVLLDMDRKIRFPYYIDAKNKSIIFFSSKEAMLVTMYGDLKRWLDLSESR